MILPSPAFAADPPASDYNRAIKAVVNNLYYITTTAEDGVKYYITPNGALTAWEEEAGMFTVKQEDIPETIDAGRLYGTAWNLDPGTGYHFTNTTLTNSKADLQPANGCFAMTSGNNRGNWERQILYMNSENKIAIRSCNTPYAESSWNDAGRTFWTYEIGDSDPMACYSYDAAYIWDFELPSEQTLILQVLNTIYDNYADYAYDGGVSLNIGTEFGQRADKETYDRFVALIEMVDKYIGDLYNDVEVDITQEDAEGMKVDADSLYQKILDSEVPYMMPKDGYYRIIAVKRYKVKGAEVSFVDKAMAASFDNAHADRGVYSTLRRDRANFLWKLTKSELGDSVMIQNAGMGTYISISSGNPENKVIMTEDVADASYVMFDYGGFEYVEPDGVPNEKDIFAIRLASSKRGATTNEKYIHQNGHATASDSNSPWGYYGTDTGVEQELSFWRRTYDDDVRNGVNVYTSEWFLESVPDDEAEALIAEFEVIKNHDQLVAQNNALREEVREALTTAKDPIKTKMITSGEQMTSPFSQNDLGGKDGGNLSDGVLIDGNSSTYWHSYYGGGATEDRHWIQLSEMSELTGDCELYLLQRATSNDHPAEITLLGSNDSDAADEDWVEIAVLPLPNYGSGQESYVSFTVNGSYSYIRVVATKVAGNEGDRGYWHAAELQLYTVRENPNSQFAILGEIAEKLEEIYNDNIAVADDDITLEIYEALLEAYNAFLTGMVDPAELRAALAAYADVTKGVVEGNNPGEWKNMDIANDFDKLYAEAKAYDQAGKYTVAQNHKYAAMLKAMSKSVKASANGIDTNKWYNIMFPTKEMFTDYGFNPSNVGGDSRVIDHPDQFGYYVVAGDSTKYVIEDEDGNTSSSYEWVVTEAENIRESANLFFADPSEIPDPQLSAFRFIEQEQDGNNAALLKTIVEDMNMAIDLSTSYTRGEALIKSAAQLSANSPDRSEGMFVEYMIDGNPNTYYHSDYHKDYLEAPYLQVALNEPVSGLIQLEVTRRNNASDGHIVRMYIQGSTDGNNWTNVGYIETPFASQGETVSSQPVNLGGTYSYLRFTLTRRNNLDFDFDPFVVVPSADMYNKADIEGWTYFHVAEFQVYSVTANNELTASGQALQNAWTAANKVLLHKASAEDVAAAAKGYKDFQSEFNAAEGMAVLPDCPEKAAPRYVIQNRATGLFVHCNGANNTENTLLNVPTLFEYTAPGYQRSFLHGFKIEGDDCSYLHSQNFDHKFVTWNNTQVDYNSGLVICEVEDEIDTPAEFSFYKDVKPGRIYTYCNPVTVTPQDIPDDASAYTCLGRYTDEFGDFLALKKIETIPAGQPAFFIYGDTAYYDSKVDDAEPMKFTFPADEKLVLHGDTINGLIGIMGYHSLKPHEIYFSGNKAICIAATNYYIDFRWMASLDVLSCPDVDPEGDYDFSICLFEEGNVADGVQDIPAAIEKISQPGDVYSLDGKLLRTGATLNSLKSLGKGMYILNGVKVAVK